MEINLYRSNYRILLFIFTGTQLAIEYTARQGYAARLWARRLNMKRIILLFLMASLTLPSVVMAGVVSPARILLVEGNVVFRTPDVEEWLPVSVNTPLDEGDAVWIPDGGKTEVQLSDGTVVRLDGGSQLDLIAVEDGYTHLHLASGRMYLRTSQKSGKNSLQIDADDTTILPEARTRLRIDMLANSQEDVSIFKGSAYVEGNGNRTIVRAGEHIALEEGHSELLPLNAPDSWETWNIERDRFQSRTAGTALHLPEELQSYSGELEANGKWVQVPEYGMVWRPIILAVDWAPYRSGRWIWKGQDYVWISYENWGWLPYHFGRWAVVSGFGWCWVPPARGDIFWGPGYVGWYRSGTHIGWTPLAPNEIFYGHGQYGRHSVNIATSSISTPNIVYKNRGARGGLNIVLQNDFLKGRVVFQKPSDTGTAALSIVLGSPRIQPVRETRMPIVRQTAPGSNPPPHRYQDNRVLKDRFPPLAPNSEKQRQTSAPAVRTAPAATRPPVALTPQQQSAQPPVRSEHPPLSPNTSRSQGEARVQGVKPTVQKEKKVWRITTTDQKSEKEQKGRK